MAKSKGGRYKTKLESTAGTGYFYTKVSGSMIGKEISKFDPKLRKHVLYKGVKLK